MIHHRMLWNYLYGTTVATMEMWYVHTLYRNTTSLVGTYIFDSILLFSPYVLFFLQILIVFFLNGTGAIYLEF